MARGKALVAELRANPKVRDAPALAAWLGRKKKLRLAALKKASAAKASKSPSKSRKRASPKPSGDEDAPRPSEVKRVSEGNRYGAVRMADRMPLAAGMQVQNSSGSKADEGTVAGVLVDGRIKVRRNNGDYYTTERRNLLINIHDPKTRKIGNDLAQKQRR